MDNSMVTPGKIGILYDDNDFERERDTNRRAWKVIEDIYGNDLIIRIYKEILLLQQ